MAEDKGSSTLSLMAVAKALADTIRKVPGIAELGSGKYVEAATYGPSEKVIGVVVTSGHDQVTVEIHAIAAASGSYPSLNLMDLADRVRLEATDVLSRLHIDSVGRIDVVFDDLRDQ